MDATNSPATDLDSERDRFLSLLGEGEWFTDGDVTLFALNDSEVVVTVSNNDLAGGLSAGYAMARANP